MVGITDLTTFIIGTTLIVLLPGPNSLYVMSIASRYGIKTGYLAAFGVFSGDLILIILTILGAASLLHAFPWLFTVLKLIGALYLGYLGVKLLIAAYRTWHPQPQISKLIANQSTKNESIKPYQTALLISLINPKAILFYLSFFLSVHDKFHRTLILSGFCLLKIAKISLNSSFFPKPIKR